MIMMVLGVLYLSLKTGTSFTGNAVYAADEATATLESALNGALFLNGVNTVSACFIISGDEEHVLKAQKDGGDFTVSESSTSCTGREDIILKFNNYDDFVATISDFSVNNLKAGMGGNRFYILPSSHVESGGNVICDATFKANYCDTLTFFGSAEELISGDLSCCMDTLTKDQQKLLAEHLASGLYQNEQPQVESPSSTGLSTYLFSAIIGMLALLGIAAVVLHMTKKTPVPPPAPDPRIVQLKNYVGKAMAAGYTRDQLYTYLKQQGWQDQILVNVFQTPSTPTNPAPQAPGKV